MRITIFRALFLFTIYSSIFAQSSIHHSDKLEHSNTKVKEPRITLAVNESSAPLTKPVFGFLPYWEIYQSTTNLRLDLLSHIAIFDFLLTEDGSLLPPPGWPDDWGSIIQEAQANRIKVLMTISNLPPGGVDPDIVTNLITSESAQQLFFNDIRNTIESNNLDGMILDFEALNIADRGEPITNFTRELRDSLDTWFTNKELSFATPAVNWGSYWNLDELAEICDYLFIMAYDYHGSWSTNAGPVAPLSGNENYNPVNYTTTIENDYTEIDPSKLILGVPYYGAEWLIGVNDPYAEVIPDGEPNSNWVGHVDYENANYIFNDYPSITFDGLSQTTYRIAQTGDDFKLVWIDIPPSLELKYDFALQKELAGIGIWSLGKDGSRNELWNLIEEKFTDSTTSVEDENLPREFVLHQNYPNPFNPSTTIKFSIPHVGTSRDLSLHTKLVVYDILGREVATLLSQKLQPGNHEVSFDARSLPSGMYFYRINLGDKFTSVKKMMLLK